MLPNTLATVSVWPHLTSGHVSRVTEGDVLDVFLRFKFVIHVTLTPIPIVLLLHDFLLPQA